MRVDRQSHGVRKDRQSHEVREDRQPRQESHRISTEEYPMLRRAGNRRRGALGPLAWE